MGDFRKRGVLFVIQGLAIRCSLTTLCTLCLCLFLAQALDVAMCSYYCSVLAGTGKGLVYIWRFYWIYSLSFLYIVAFVFFFVVVVASFLLFLEVILPNSCLSGHIGANCCTHVYFLSLVKSIQHCTLDILKILAYIATTFSMERMIVNMIKCTRINLTDCAKQKYTRDKRAELRERVILVVSVV